MVNHLKFISRNTNFGEEEHGTILFHEDVSDEGSTDGMKVASDNGCLKPTIRGTLLCVTHIPSFMIPSELLEYFSTFLDRIQAIFIFQQIDDTSHYLSLVLLDSEKSATDLIESYHGHPIGTSLEPAVCCIYSVKQVYYEASAGNNIRQMSPIAMQMHNVISRDEDADHPKSVSSTHSSKSYGTSFQTTEESELVNIEHSHWPVDKDHIQPQDAPARVMYNCDAGPHSSDDMLKVFTSHNGRHSSMHHAGLESPSNSLCVLCLEPLNGDGLSRSLSPSSLKNIHCHSLSHTPAEGSNEPTSITSNNSTFTSFCQHTFHIHCMEKLESSQCPVCRFEHHNSEVSMSRCMICQFQPSTNSSAYSIFPPERSQVDIAAENSLWVCLICGFIGCGDSTSMIQLEQAGEFSASSQTHYDPYSLNHAFEHYKNTLHTYAINVNTNLVWDFAGGGYVHRLLLYSGDDSSAEEVEDGSMARSPSQPHIDSRHLGQSQHAGDTGMNHPTDTTATAPPMKMIEVSRPTPNTPGHDIPVSSNIGQHAQKSMNAFGSLEKPRIGIQMLDGPENASHCAAFERISGASHSSSNTCSLYCPSGSSNSSGFRSSVPPLNSQQEGILIHRRLDALAQHYRETLAWQLDHCKTEYMSQMMKLQQFLHREGLGLWNEGDNLTGAGLSSRHCGDTKGNEEDRHRPAFTYVEEHDNLQNSQQGAEEARTKVFQSLANEKNKITQQCESVRERTIAASKELSLLVQWNKTLQDNNTQYKAKLEEALTALAQEETRTRKQCPALEQKVAKLMKKLEELG